MGDERNIISGPITGAFSYMKQSLLPIAVFKMVNGLPAIEVISKGFVSLCGNEMSYDEVMDLMKKSAYAFVHPDDIDKVTKASEAFMREEAPYDVMFRVRSIGFGKERNVHGVGYHEYMEDGNRYAIFTYEDITSYIRVEREKSSKLESTINNIINNDDYAIAIIDEVTHELFLFNPSMESVIPPANFFTTGMTFEEYFYGSSEKRNNIFETLVNKGDKLYVDPYTGAELAIRVSSVDWNGKKALYIKGSNTADSYYDKLTTLPNKTFFLERGNTLYRQYLSQDMNPYVLYMNMKGLHYYNNAFGFEEGNKLLIGMALVLKKAFPKQVISRFAADHFFMLIDDKPDENLLKEVAEEIRDLGQMAVEVKFGYKKITDDIQNISECVDDAKTACEAIKGSIDTTYSEYLDSMNKDTMLKKYVIENIDRAVARGYIKVYYQPVVRTLTGKVCGAEALARWVDPRKGILNVGVVISALEESHQIHKLDCCIIEQVCKEYRDCVDEGKTPVPISVNLSRIDFVCCDIFNSIERSRRKYSVPRNMINLEITESVFGSEASVRAVVTKFRDVGYQVWMDDFGSGYSSLNLLKEFSFDEVKLDMAFLSNFSDKGKSIIKSTISMAKDIGIYTLAEGVETEEQYEFLKKIGCEKVQGFLFERPLPYDQFIESCNEKNYEIEEPIWRDYYDEIGKSKFLSDKPVSIVEWENDELKHLFANHLYVEYKNSIGQSDDELMNEGLNDKTSPFYKAIQSFIKRDGDIDDSFSLTVLENNSYVSLSCKCITKCVGKYVFYVNIESVSDNEVGNTHKNTDNVIRNLYYVYDNVALINLDDDTGEEIFSDDSFKVSSEVIFSNYQNRMITFAQTNIHEADYERFVEYVDFSTIRSRMKENNSNMISDYFRFVDSNGSYHWKLLNFIKSTGNPDNQIICSIREVPRNRFDTDVL
ncbi:MAG: EAL domain-containing protein [Saccharofermentans sp.]|nr:EAL domain-containing protein [Saccharofermentans sp.]